MELSREGKYKIVHKKLLWFTIILIITIVIVLSSFTINETPFVMFIVLLAGILGGFVSIQQRMKDIRDDELTLLSETRFAILLVPVNSGIFAIALMLLFASGIIQGELFPKYPDIPTQTIEELYVWLKCGFPESGQDLAKLFFWSFVAGFNERFVPQIINSTITKGSS